ncbi:MAG: TMEM175 family protein [Verrucomicrobiota bacterium]|nr:TMEM175 family protein [Verrucomicrobiota bacterium]
MNERDEEIRSVLPADLDVLPRLRGFRLRGIQMTRLETFIDAAFAFAISMLVIAAQQIPDNIQALLAAFKNVPTFVCCIAVLGIYWRGHWLWSRRYGLEDGVSILISWALIVTILIFIYPLKAIFGAMWNFLTNGQVGQPFSLHTTEAQARTIFAVYALGLIAISAEILLLYLRAWQLREPLRLNARERLMTRGELTGWSIPVSLGLVSLLFSFTLPIEQIAWCGWVYFLMAIMVRVHRFWHGRRLKENRESAQVEN